MEIAYTLLRFEDLVLVMWSHPTFTSNFHVGFDCDTPFPYIFPIKQKDKDASDQDTV